MATLIKIRGLDRAKASADTSPIARGFRVPHQFQAAVGGTAAKASRTPTAATVTFTAKFAGTWGNNVSIQTATGTLAVATTFATTTNYPTILVTAPATASLAANQAVVAAVNADAVASQYVVASIAGAGTTAWAIVGAAAMTGGTDTGATFSPIGFNRVTAAASVVVDIDDAFTRRLLRRNSYRYVSLGLA